MKRRDFFLMAAVTCSGSAVAFGQSAPSQFVGKWSGNWGGTLASNLVIESVSESGEFQGVYSWGTNQLVLKAGSTRIMGKIQGGILAWGNPIQGIGFKFRFLPDGTLEGERWNHGGRDGLVVMTKL